jgi:hypothetical protein
LEGSRPERDGPIPAAAIPDEDNRLPGVIAADSIVESEEMPSSPPDTMTHGGSIPNVLFIHEDWEKRAGFVGEVVASSTPGKTIGYGDCQNGSSERE